MDLYAYSQINNLAKIAEKNGINCPRLRGYRLMKNEEAVTNEFWKSDEFVTEIVFNLCHSIPFWTYGSGVSEYSYETDMKESYFIDTDRKVRWDRIKGWKRKALKTAIHNHNARYKRQYDTWNKYVGMDNILYIHARIGGGNWSTYYKDVAFQPWFIEKVDDAFDNTYCDIYAKIK